MAFTRWWYALPISLIAACGADSTGSEGSGNPEGAADPSPAPGAPSMEGRAVRAAYVGAVQRGASPAYRLERAAGGVLRADNPAQELRVEMAPGGVRVATAAQPELAFDMALEGVGCAGALEPALAAEPEASGNRSEYRRGSLVEWYLNGPLGLEQGFTLGAAPACRAAGGEDVTIALRTGGLAAELSASADAALLRDEAGRVILRYTDLYVTDALGRELPARLASEEGRLSIHVDDSGATYPIVIDPIVWAEQAKLVAADGVTGDDLGRGVAIDGDTALVGAPERDDKGQNSGAVYVFIRNGGVWTQTQKITASDGTANDGFGYAVAISGNLAIVGAPFDVTERGCAYVFQRSSPAANFLQLQKLTAGDGAAGDRFGRAVSISGNYAVIGAPLDDITGKGNDTGSAYVYYKAAANFGYQAKISPADSLAGDELGTSVGISGDTVVVGAYGHDANGSVAGAAYAFLRAGTAWNQQAKILPVDVKANDWFGYSAAISGDTAIFGAPLAVGGAGVAYTYTRAAGVWSLEKKLIPLDTDSGDSFGYAVGINVDTAIVGARYDEAKGSTAGSAYVFVRSAGMWKEEKKVTASDAGANDQFGTSVSVFGTSAVVGAPVHDNAATDSGAAYVFTPLDKSDNGVTCTKALDCASGFCVDGVCCATACGGGAANDCQACNVPAKEGTCSPAAAGTACRAAAGVCDVGEACDGASLNCPADAKVMAGTECRASNGACDAAEACNGASNDCPADALAQAGTVCRAANGACDAAEACDGASIDCPGDMFAPPGTVCRAKAGVCDVGEACDGAGPDCPADTKVAAGTTCRAKVSACDAAEACDGAGSDCPANAAAPAGTLCRTAQGDCDAAEACDGAGFDCPADVLAAAGTECRAANGACDVAEACDGATANCPANALAAAGTECRASAGECDVAETCDGAKANCPADALAKDGTTCSDGACKAGVCEDVTGTGGAGGEGGRGGAGGEGGAATTGSGGGLPLPTDDGGCGCRVAGAPAPDAKGLCGLGLGLLFFARRRRARSNGMA